MSRGPGYLQRRLLEVLVRRAVGNLVPDWDRARAEPWRRIGDDLPQRYVADLNYVRLSRTIGAHYEGLALGDRYVELASSFASGPIVDHGRLDLPTEPVTRYSSATYFPHTSSVRRALHALAQRGYVELAYDFDDCFYGADARIAAKIRAVPHTTREILIVRLSAGLPSSKELAYIFEISDWGEHILGLAEASFDLLRAPPEPESLVRRWEYHYSALHRSQEVRRLAPTICADFADPWQWLYIEHLAETHQIELFRVHT